MLTPEEVSDQERIFESDGVLRWIGSSPFAKARIGIPLQCLLSSWAHPHITTGSIRDVEHFLPRLINIYGAEEYLLWYDVRSKEALIVLKEGASPRSLLKAWAFGLWVAHRNDSQDATSAMIDEVFGLLESTLKDLSERWEDCIERLLVAGWDIEIANLETTSGTRIRLHTDINHEVKLDR